MSNSDIKDLKELVQKMDAEVNSKMDKMGDELTNVRIITEKNTVILEEHQRRSELAEENIALLRDEVQSNEKDRIKEMKPVTKHINMIQGFIKYTLIIVTVGGFVGGIIKYLLDHL